MVGGSLMASWLILGARGLNEKGNGFRFMLEYEMISCQSTYYKSRRS